MFGAGGVLVLPGGDVVEDRGFSDCLYLSPHKFI